MKQFDWKPGRLNIEHRWQTASILGQAFRHEVPLTCIRASATTSFRTSDLQRRSHRPRGGMGLQLFGGSVENLDGGVVLSVGSAIMGPQVFEEKPELC